MPRFCGRRVGGAGGFASYRESRVRARRWGRAAAIQRREIRASLIVGGDTGNVYLKQGFFSLSRSTAKTGRQAPGVRRAAWRTPPQVPRPRPGLFPPVTPCRAPTKRAKGGRARLGRVVNYWKTARKTSRRLGI